MSQSSKTLHEFGSVSIKENLTLKTGSTTALGAKVTPDATTVADADATLTVAQIRSGIVIQTPTAARALTLPTAAELADFLQVVGDTIDFNVINLGTDGLYTTIATGTGGSIVGFATVRDSYSTSTTASDSGSATFRIRQTNVNPGNEAYVCYRLV